MPVDRGRVDILFVVDNSHSMEEEQSALAAEFPRLLRKLTSGDHDGDGVAEQQRVTDLHLAVVTTDVAEVPSAELLGCANPNDARFVRTANAPGCDASYPAFLDYLATQNAPVGSQQLAEDFACVAQVGVKGCGFEQPLEAALKALWPSGDATFSFFGTDPFGRGDRENAGFLRNGADGERAATLAIVLITDEDDCSTWDPSIFEVTADLPLGDPAREQSPNLRCFLNPDRLHDLDRYLQSYRALHARTDARVLFAAIAGVPVDLVDQKAIADVDFADDVQREAFYERILADPRMQEVPAPSTEPQTANLTPSCMSAFGLAYPPRRIVELARRFGQHGLVQSICGDNFGPPIDRVVDSIPVPQ